jgi:co-chaperonin GroES (HSP10)
MRPLHDKIIVERIAAEKTTSSGIILRSSDEADKAKVIAIGPDVDEVAVGDIVLLNWNGAIKTGEHYVLRIEHVVLIYGE